MSTSVSAVDVVLILGKLNDEGGDNSSRNRFIQGYLSKYTNPGPIIADIQALLEAYTDFRGDRESLERAYGDLINRLAEVSGFSVDYVRYSGREKITGIWKVNEGLQIKVAAMICESYEEAKGVARNALLILPETMELGRPFVTVGHLGKLFSMVEQIELPISSVASILMTDDDYDKRIESFMELMILAFRKELSRKPLQTVLQREWTKEQLEEFLLRSLKPATAAMIFALVDSSLEGEQLVERINRYLQMKGEERIKGPMALGAMMGALSKHYSGIREELVLREGKSYRLNTKYRDIISEIRSRYQTAT